MWCILMVKNIESTFIKNETAVKQKVKVMNQ